MMRKLETCGIIAMVTAAIWSVRTAWAVLVMRLSATNTRTGSGGYRDQVVQEGKQSEKGRQRNDRADADHITCMCPHALVGRVADIGGRREGRTEQRADHGADTVGDLAGCHRIVVACGFRALHVVHRFDEIVDLHRHQHQEQLRMVEQVLDPGHQVAKVGNGRIEADTLEADCRLTGGQRDPGADHQGQQAGRNVERQAEPPDEAPQDDDH